MVTRRAVLRVSSTGLLLSLAGCQSTVPFLSNGTMNSFDVANYSDQSHIFHVRVANQNDQTVFEQTFEVASGKSSSDNEFSGTPSTIQVQVDDAPAQAFEWPECADGRLAKHIEVDFGKDTQMDETIVYGDC